MLPKLLFLIPKLLSLPKVIEFLFSVCYNIGVGYGERESVRILR